ncbi:hypothetical protein Pmani_033729 [Petrolisthes manimaculis]|uniref:Uncharacterized protein n=1 Tax=Petrolisthes manimaculis TaxID=1843537 RepID=A0AAE1NPW0_9EUCA|nr:hypothetical protein Pmani_033729 [Petrolisthes manimaculis]
MEGVKRRRRSGGCRRKGGVMREVKIEEAAMRMRGKVGGVRRYNGGRKTEVGLWGEEEEEEDGKKEEREEQDK